MARAMVVYESMFGQTEAVARAVAAGVAQVRPVEVVGVADAPTGLGGVDLVLAGGPTHAFSMSRPTTRRDARTKGATEGSEAVGLREWLGSLGDDEHAAVVTFDTRVTSARHLPGSAARSALRAARRHGLQTAAPPESFYVEDLAGPLVAGELERARVWGRDVALSVSARPSRQRRGGLSRR